MGKNKTRTNRKKYKIRRKKTKRRKQKGGLKIEMLPSSSPGGESWDMPYLHTPSPKLDMYPYVIPYNQRSQFLTNEEIGLLSMVNMNTNNEYHNNRNYLARRRWPNEFPGYIPRPNLNYLQLKNALNIHKLYYPQQEPDWTGVSYVNALAANEARQASKDANTALYNYKKYVIKNHFKLLFGELKDFYKPRMDNFYFDEFIKESMTEYLKGLFNEIYPNGFCGYAFSDFIDELLSIGFLKLGDWMSTDTLDFTNCDQNIWNNIIDKNF